MTKSFPRHIHHSIDTASLQIAIAPQLQKWALHLPDRTSAFVSPLRQSAAERLYRMTSACPHLWGAALAKISG